MPKFTVGKFKFCAGADAIKPDFDGEFTPKEI